jgi:hypothetical protein
MSTIIWAIILQLHHDSYGFPAVGDPFSDYMQTPTSRVEVEKGFPKFTFQYTQSAQRKLLGNDFQFVKLILKRSLRRNI